MRLINTVMIIPRLMQMSDNSHNNTTAMFRSLEVPRWHPMVNCLTPAHYSNAYQAYIGSAMIWTILVNLRVD